MRVVLLPRSARAVLQQDLASASGQEILGGPCPDVIRADRRSAGLAPHETLAVERYHERRQHDVRALHNRMGADGHLASAAKRADHRPLCIERRMRGAIVNAGQDGSQPLVVVSDLHGNDALPGCRNARLNWNQCGDPSTMSQALQSGRRKHDGIEVSRIQLAQSGVEIPPDGQKLRAPKHSRELRNAAHAARADTGRRSKPGQHGVDVGMACTVWQGTRASRGSSRGSVAATSRPSGRTAGISLLLCTARSTSPPASASSISLTNSRLPPISDRLASASRSPDVLMTTISHVCPEAA